MVSPLPPPRINRSNTQGKQEQSSEGKQGKEQWIGSPLMPARRATGKPRLYSPPPNNPPNRAQQPGPGRVNSKHHQHIDNLLPPPLPPTFPIPHPPHSPLQSKVPQQRKESRPKRASPSSATEEKEQKDKKTEKETNQERLAPPLRMHPSSVSPFAKTASPKRP